MPVDDTGVVFDLAVGVLDAVVAYYESYVDADGQLPQRRYVSDGIPAWDAEQVTVHVIRTFSLDGSSNIETTTFPIGPLVRRGCEIAVSVIRCTPTVDQDGPDIVMPDPAAVQASAQQVYADPERIADAIVEAYQAGSLGVCSGVFFAGWSGLGPEGGLVGGQALLRMVLD